MHLLSGMSVPAASVNSLPLGTITVHCYGYKIQVANGESIYSSCWGN